MSVSTLSSERENSIQGQTQVNLRLIGELTGIHHRVINLISAHQLILKNGQPGLPLEKLRMYGAGVRLFRLECGLTAL